MFALADIGIPVKDSKLAAKWWEEKLGFRSHTLSGSGHAVLIAPPGERFVLHLCQGPPLEPGDWGIAFVTDEIEAFDRRLKENGVRISEAMHKTEWGSRRLKFSDPDGNVFWMQEAPTKMVEETLRMRAPTS